MSAPESMPSGSGPTRPADGAPYPAAPLPGEPDDADDLHGIHVRALLRSTETWVYLLGGPLLLGALFVFVFSVRTGAFVFVAAFLIGLGVVSRMAGSRSADDFFFFYARRRGMTAGGKRSLPPDTPLLRSGDDRYAERSVIGDLAPGVRGTLAIFTSVTESASANGTRSKQYHPFTLGMTEVPGSSPHLRGLYCRPRSGPRSLDRLGDAFRGSKERVEVESQVLTERFEIFCNRGQDANWLRQFLSPSFIVWLTESTPDSFGFEIDTGTVVAFVGGHREDAADLDLIAAATVTVAKRLREETAESAEIAG